MRVLVTGSQGAIGKFVVDLLHQSGFEVRSFDRVASPPSDWEHRVGEIRDGSTVRQAAMGCDALVHLAAVPGDYRSNHDDVFTTNVNGTWNVLQAAKEIGIGRVVYFSSVQALGMGSRDYMPEKLPVDDSSSPRPRPAYGLSKWVCEEMCQSFSRHHGISTYCLRPSQVIPPEAYEYFRRMGTRRYTETSRNNCFTYVDSRDVASAVVCCLRHTGEAHHGRYLLVARDNSIGVPTADLLKEHFPAIPWVGGPHYLDDRYRALIDSSAARDDLGWEPAYSWRETEGEGIRG